MTQICRLFALHSVETNLGFYLSEGILTAQQGKNIGEVARSVTSKLGLYALDLVKIFGIPDEIIHAPIANNWIKYNEVDNQGEIIIRPQYQKFSSRI